MEPPIRIKLYGFFPITKRGYLIQLAIVAVLLLVLFGAWLRLPPMAELHDLPAEYLRLRSFLGWIPWFVLGFAVLIGIEATLVLRRFAREEAQRRQQLSTPADKSQP